MLITVVTSLLQFLMPMEQGVKCTISAVLGLLSTEAPKVRMIVTSFSTCEKRGSIWEVATNHHQPPGHIEYQGVVERQSEDSSEKHRDSVISASLASKQ